MPIPKPPLCSVCDTAHTGKDCPPLGRANPRIRYPKPKVRPTAACKGGGKWLCIICWVTGSPGTLCPVCNAYASTILEMYDRRRREQRVSDLFDIREMHFRELVRVFGQGVAPIERSEFDWFK